MLTLAIMTARASAALAEEMDVAQISVKRQLVACMNKSMSANKTLSYNDAQRDCKERLVSRREDGIGKPALTANASDAPALKTP